jgi:hypothetical protein
VQRRPFTIAQVLFYQVPYNSRLGATPRPGMAFQQLDLTPFHLESYRFHSLTVLLKWQ